MTAPSRRVAHKPHLAPQGLDARKVGRGEGFALYMIDSGRNNSKFYEGLMLPNDDGTFRVMLRWGALTDNGFTGRIDGARFDAKHAYLSEREAKAVLAKKYRAKTGKGYVDAWKHNLAKGQYPVGLKRDVGFGWGVQEAAFCIPALRLIGQHLLTLLGYLRRPNVMQASILLDSIIELNATEIRAADSTMAKKISDNLDHMKGRADRLLDNAGQDMKAEIKNWTTAVSRLASYITKQLSVCHGKVVSARQLRMPIGDVRDASDFSKKIAALLRKNVLVQKVKLGPMKPKGRKLTVIAHGDLDFKPALEAIVFGLGFKRQLRSWIHPQKNIHIELDKSLAYDWPEHDIFVTVMYGWVDIDDKKAAGFNPKEIGKVKRPEGDPDELRIVKDTDQRWFSEMQGEATKPGPAWDGHGPAPDPNKRVTHLATRFLLSKQDPDRVARVTHRYLAALKG